MRVNECAVCRDRPAEHEAFLATQPEATTFPQRLVRDQLRSRVDGLHRLMTEATQ